MAWLGVAKVLRKPSPAGVDLRAVMAAELAPQYTVVDLEQVGPLAVAELHR